MPSPAPSSTTTHAAKPGAVVSEWHCSGRRSAWQEEHLTQAMIELPLTGMDMRSIRGQQTVVDVGTAVLHGADESFALASPTARPRRSTSIALDGELLGAMAPDFTPGVVRTSARTALLQQRLRRQGADPLARDELGLMLVDSVMADARLQAGARAGIPSLSPAWRRLADELGQCMAVGFDQALSLEQLARSCGTSPFHASRVYRRVTGLSMHRQLNRLRLREALFRLPEMRGRLTELALDLGFSSHSHFSSAFRAEFGRAPSALG
ncbi:AraC family transcriptional regulator [Paucibacter sediminis]|uniref:AraC family transcriptional regulator n=1 Tax=Paucibacter sediminis TaxID=3019553 RepID=A0AA95NGW7_9BURK|nr:AraC family transcriptional regulator [Paucibacter sp. S2-9]WIT12104.1 AraC family transcriptional regulator [Paucibacter sp. S2-9]